MLYYAEYRSFFFAYLFMREMSGLINVFFFFSWALEEPDSLASNKAGSRPFCFPHWKGLNTDPMLCLEEEGRASFESRPICIGGQNPLCWCKRGCGMLPLINAELDILKTSSRSTKFTVDRMTPQAQTLSHLELFRRNWIARPDGSDLEKWVNSCWQLVLFGFDFREHNFP